MAKPGPDKSKPSHETSSGKPEPSNSKPSKKRRRRRWRALGIFLVLLVLLFLALMLATPPAIHWYTNRILDQGLLYQGEIGQVRVRPWRGAYSIEEIRIVKQIGNVPVPFFSAKRVDFTIEWPALLEGKIVGKMVMHGPELNFVDGETEADDQSGLGTPWLTIIRDLYPFKINSTEVHDGSIHFRAYATNPPVDVYLSNVNASVENLTNVHDEITPLVATVHATGLAMDQAKFEYEMKLDPSSYRPTFELAVRVLGLDVTKLNDLAQSYGGVDFEDGWFDLVVELEAEEGGVEGYVKPLFRDLQVLSPSDASQANVLELFWEAVVGVTTGIFKNPPRDQFGTMIPVRGTLNDPKSDLFTIVGNVLRNAFVRAYLPNYEGAGMEGLEFGPGEISQVSRSGAQ